MDRSKSLIKLADIWFSPKSLSGEPRVLVTGGRETDSDCGGQKPTLPSQTPNTGHSSAGSQTLGDKLLGQKGNSPDRRLRPQNHAKCERKWECEDSQDVGLEAATI